VTYCWNNVDIAITIQRDWVHEEDGKRREVVLTEPLRTGNGKFVRYTILFLR
jgi:hypothetical protein